MANCVREGRRYRRHKWIKVRGKELCKFCEVERPKRPRRSDNRRARRKAKSTRIGALREHFEQGRIKVSAVMNPGIKFRRVPASESWA